MPLGGLDNNTKSFGKDFEYTIKDTAPSNVKEEGVVVYNEQAYKLSFIFDNSQQEKYNLNPQYVVQWCLETDLLTWPLRGYVIVRSQWEAFEKSETPDWFYHIRSDSRDKLTIKLEVKPIPLQGVPDTDPEIWDFEVNAVIYDVEDLSTPNKELKMKKLYFWDEKFQFLQEKRIQWCTATGKRYKSPQPKDPIAHASDIDKSMLTGEAVWSLLVEAGYEEYIDITKWNWGKSKINYTTKSNWSIWENIQYILKHHISDINDDICILQWNRGRKKWTLMPFNEIFVQAGHASPGPLQREHLIFEDGVSELGDKETRRQDVKPSPWKAPWIDDPTWDIDIKSVNNSTILSYRFSQTSGLDSSTAWNTKPVYSHWHTKKQFDVDVRENEIAQIRDNHIKPQYIEDKLLYEEIYPVMTLNQTRMTEYNIDPQFSPVVTLGYENDRPIRSLYGKGKVLYSAIFLNQCMTVRLLGASYRTAGTFTGVDRTYESSDTDFDYQLCGQYLVTNVKHIFQLNRYVTDLTMVKIHAYKTLQDNEDIP